MRQTVGILGTPIDILNTEEVLLRLEQFIAQGRFHQVATANTDFLINALADTELRHILRNADLVVPDGMPVVWAARLMRSRLPERVTGADMVPQLAQLAAQKGYRVFMLGARDEIAERARVRLEKDYPGLQIVGRMSPPPKPLMEMDNEAILSAIHAARPHILFVAFGNPKQEKWIYQHREQLREVPICIGVGGTFDFLAGETSRAPAWMQTTGLEWIYRLFQEPRRLWRRYTRDMVQFSRYLVRQWWGLHRGQCTGNSEIFTADVGDRTILSIRGDLTAPMLPHFQEAANQAIDSGKHVILDFGGVTAFDGEALGTLINLPKRAAFRGSDVYLVCVPPPIVKALRRSQLQDGLLKMADSVAQAFSNSHAIGLCWHIQSGQQAAVMTVTGSADRESVARLEYECGRLLASGKRVDLDLRTVTYIDTTLLAALFRHCATYRSETGETRLRLVPGEVVHYVLEREKVVGKFTLIAAPELPPDAISYVLVDDQVTEDIPATPFVTSPRV